MSGSFEDLHVPPTLVSFAVTTEKAENIISDDFKRAGSKVYLLKPKQNQRGLPPAADLLPLFDRVTKLMREGKVLSCYTPGFGGVGEAVMKMAFGNGFGFCFSEDVPLSELFGYQYGSFVIETEETLEDAMFFGQVTEEKAFVYACIDIRVTEEKKERDKLDSKMK